MPAKLPRRELRRRPRTKVSWPVVVELDDRVLLGETIDVSQLGVKLRLRERLGDGALVTLHLTPPKGCPVDAPALVLRTDREGPVLLFLKQALAIVPAANETALPGPRVLTILVVDDDRGVVSLVRDILASSKYLVLFSQDPFTAIRLVKELPGDIDILIADVIMPLMDGRELARRVLEIRPKVKILLMSGFEMPGLRDSGWPVLAKPFNITELTEKIDECIAAKDQPPPVSATPPRSAGMKRAR